MSVLKVVVKRFTDKEDNDHIYYGGDVYPREGLEVSEKRIEALKTGKNKAETVIIAEVPEPTDFEEVEQEGQQENQEPEIVEENEVENENEEEQPVDEPFQDLSNDELKALLDEKGIEYKAKDTKKELIAKLGA